ICATKAATRCKAIISVGQCRCRNFWRRSATRRISAVRPDEAPVMFEALQHKRTATTTRGAPGPFKKIRLILKDRPDSEHEMSINRLVFCTLVVVYLAYGLLSNDDHVQSLLTS